MEGSGTPETLVTVFLDGREICRKIHQLNTVAEIPDVCKTSLNSNAECDRLLKFNTDLNEFIDTDINGNVQNLDKYNILFKSIKPNDPRKELAEQQSTGAACPGGQLENGQGQIDGAHIFNADSLRDDKLGTLSVTSRRLLVKIGVSNLVERKGFYPSNVDKQMLAKSIMAVFPSLKMKLREENEGFEHFYDPVSHCGFIELKLRNLRRTLHDDQRRYRKRGRSSDSSGVIITLEPLAEGEEESIKEWVTVTKRLRPSPENLASIKMGMEKTFTSRRLWITSKSPTVTDIFQQYPRFVDLPYLLDEEFGKIYPGKKDLFLRKWEGYIVPKLLKVATLENETSVHPDEESDESRCFRALQLLTHYLPPTSSGRAKG
nr:uncharacterized protein LOC111851367 isoform X2 [Paramormyrops kingsleyae]